uniref:Uncharacterized protein n=1 Tax=Arundo donax TaxID=35708 RepID=A0A0A9D410_ARUDO
MFPSFQAKTTFRIPEMRCTNAESICMQPPSHAPKAQYQTKATKQLGSLPTSSRILNLTSQAGTAFSSYLKLCCPP